MSLMTINEFVKSGVFPLVRNKNDVYMLIRMGGLKTVKKGKRRYIITNETDIDSSKYAVKEKRNRKFCIKLPEVVYKLIAVVADREKKSVEEYIDDFAEKVKVIFSYIENSKGNKEIEISCSQIEYLFSQMLFFTKEINNLNKDKRINFHNRKRIDRFNFIFPYKI